MKALFAALLFLFTTAANAGPVYSYDVSLTVTSVGPKPQPCTYSAPNYGCSLAAGDVWKGLFSVATDLTTLANGKYNIPLTSFFLRAGDIDYTTNYAAEPYDCLIAKPHQNCLSGFRDGFGNFSGTSIGFNVLNGSIGFAGGLYGAGDSVFIDFDYFFSPNAGKFYAQAATTTVNGTYAITAAAVPEPGSICLAITALVGAAFATRRRSIPKAAA